VGGRDAAGVSLAYDWRRDSARKRRERKAALSVDLMSCFGHDEWRSLCPYGIWTCRDGRQVLFNRQYWAILERYPGKPTQAANPGEWVSHIEQEHFFDDSNSPWSGRSSSAAKSTIERINRVLVEWGVPPLPPLPRWNARRRQIKATPWKFTTNPPPRVNLWKEVLEARDER
jgi:hypothetical protein